jgi:hypothetical protein
MADMSRGRAGEGREQKRGEEENKKRKLRSQIKRRKKERLVRRLGVESRGKSTKGMGIEQ